MKAVLLYYLGAGLLILAFVLGGCSSARPKPAVPPTAPSTATAEPVPVIDVLPTETSVPPTATPVQPTATPIPPTARPIPPAIPYSSFVELRAMSVPADDIASLALSPDGSIMAYGTYADESIHLVSAATGEEIATLEGHTTAVTSLAFSPDGQLLVSAGTVNLPPDEDKTVRLWDVSTKQQLAVFETSGTNEIAFSPDGALLATAGSAEPQEIRLWDVAERAEKGRIASVFIGPSFSPDGALLAAGTRDDLVHILDSGTGKEILSLAGHEGLVTATAFSPDGELLASGGEDHTIRLWDADTGKPVRTLTGHTSQPEFLRFSPDGRVLTSLGSGMSVTRQGDRIQIGFGSRDRLVRFWDIETGKQIGTIDTMQEGDDKSPGNGVDSLAFNSDWTLIATATGDIVQLWSVKP